MPIVIKEIHVHTTVEQKVVVREEVAENLCARLKGEILEELSAGKEPGNAGKTKRER